jgi:nuclear protein localization family protein 4
MLRLTVENSDTFGKLAQELASKLPDDVDMATLTMSNAPNGGDSKSIQAVAQVPVGKIGLR